MVYSLSWRLSSLLAKCILFQHTCHQANWRSKRARAQPPKHLLQNRSNRALLPYLTPTTSNPGFLASTVPCRSSIKRSFPGCSNASVIASASPSARQEGPAATDVLRFTTFSLAGGLATRVRTATGAFPCDSSFLTARGIKSTGEARSWPRGKEKVPPRWHFTFSDCLPSLCR